MKFLLVLLTVLSLGKAFANEADNKILEETLNEGPCQKLAATLTPEQKTAIKTDMAAFRHKVIDFKAALKHSCLNYRTEIMNGNHDGAVAQGTAMAATKAQMFSSKMDFQTNILLNVLTAEQRKSGLCCIKHMGKKFHHGRRDQAKVDEIDSEPASADL
ncbi:MAG: hypothetical protein ACHQYQ_09205 [Bacteriovoracales bacterium]